MQILKWIQSPVTSRFLQLEQLLLTFINKREYSHDSFRGQLNSIYQHADDRRRFIITLFIFVSLILPAFWRFSDVSARGTQSLNIKSGRWIFILWWSLGCITGIVAQVVIETLWIVPEVIEVWETIWEALV